MKNMSLVLAIVLLLGGLFSTVYYGVQWQMVASETMENIDRLEARAESEMAAGEEEKAMDTLEVVNSELDYYREKKDLSNLGYMVGIPAILIGLGFFWKWRKME